MALYAESMAYIAPGSPAPGSPVNPRTSTARGICFLVVVAAGFARIAGVGDKLIFDPSSPKTHTALDPTALPSLGPASGNVTFSKGWLGSSDACIPSAGVGVLAGGIDLADSPVAPRLFENFLAPSELARLNRLVAVLPPDAWRLCSAASKEGLPGKECALLEVRPDDPVLQSIGELMGVEAALSTLPLIRYAPGSAAMVAHVDRMADGRIPDISLILHLSGAPATGHGRTLFPALGLAVGPKAGALLSWRNTDTAGRPLADASHAVESLPASASAPRVSIQLPLMLRGT